MPESQNVVKRPVCLREKVFNSPMKKAGQRDPLFLYILMMMYGHLRKVQYNFLGLFGDICG